MTSDGKPWMKAYVYVARSPLADSSEDTALVQMDGIMLERFGFVSIEGIPAGEHRVLLWHEALGRSERSVRFPVSEGDEIEFDPKPQ